MYLLKKNPQNSKKSITIKTIVFSLVFIFISVNTQAQFFKKLKEKAAQKIEREAERRAQRRVDEKIDKVYDKAEDGIDGKGNPKKNNQTKNVNLPASYDFEWEYALKMESKETRKKGMDGMKIIYYLNPNTTAFGSKFEIGNKSEFMGNMFTIMDFDYGVSIMLMDTDEGKFIQQMPSFSNDDIDEVAQEQNVKDYTIVKIDTKTILGYSCQGFKITSKDGIIKMYIAKNAPVSFNNTMSGNSKFKPKGFNTAWLKEFENGLMMEMDFKSNKKQKYDMKMTCISLERKPLHINLSEYKSFGY
jgi:hypothetical protein